jgi:hypothetical protein
MSPRRVVVGLDQASRSGWGIALERGPVVASGVARKHAERMAVIERAIELAADRDAWGRHAPDPHRVFVLFEQHDHMPLTRGTGHDRQLMQRIARGEDEQVNRGAKQVHGMGKAYGRWLEVLDAQGVLESMRAEVRPSTWRSRLHGVTSGDVKRAARDWASRRAGRRIDDDDEAEGYCIAAFAALDGIARHDAECMHAKAKARGVREAKRQGSLFGSGGGQP